jgi:hypothetical protein
MSDAIAYDKGELRRITGAFKAMDAETVEQMKTQSSALAEYLGKKIQNAGGQRTRSAKAVQRTVDGYRVSKSSKIGELSYGFAGQKFSGGATTQMLWGGLEFGSKKWRQFPTRNKLGYFIYPTLRNEQKYLIDQWERAFSEIVGKWDD